METFYRKYRPQNFAEVFGQNHIKITLQNEIETGKIAHAYLFCGPRAIGKTSLARIFSKAINCLDRREGEHEPCNKCLSCSEINKGSNIDILEIDAASQTGVDNVRENIITASRVMPSLSKYKIFIIDEVHMLSLSAFNALLKIIEEPPRHVIFILCTTEIHKVPATIISRCQRFDFKRIGFLDQIKKMNYIAKEEGIDVEQGVLEDIARSSEGHMRDAESIFGQIASIGGKKITKEDAYLVIPASKLFEAVKLISLIAKKDAANSILLINKLADEGVSLKNFVKETIELLRKILFIKISSVLEQRLSIEVGESLELEIRKFSELLNPDDIIGIIEKFIDAKNKMKDSFIEQMPLEIAIIKLTSSLKAPIQNFPANQITKNNEKEKKNISDKKTGAVIALEDITEKWHEVLAKIKQQNHSLSFIFNVCQPQTIKGNILSLAFKYKFHKERIADAQIKILVERVLKEVYQATIIIETIMDENLNISDVTQKNNIDKNEKNPDNGIDGNTIVDSLLKTFGGRVIN